MKTFIRSTELLPKLDTIMAYLVDPTIGFVKPHKVLKSKSPFREDFRADLGGSGTLVSACGVRAILTADHVFDKNTD